MCNEEKDIENIYRILETMLYNYAAYKAIRNHSAKEYGVLFRPDIRLFWAIVSNNCLQMSAVDWCKVFGSKNNNKTHFSHFIDPDIFESKLSRESVDLVTCSKEMKSFRDKYISHSDNYDSPVPYFDSSLKVVFIFDAAVKERYREQTDVFPNLRETYLNYMEILEDYIREIKLNEC